MTTVSVQFEKIFDCNILIDNITLTLGTTQYSRFNGVINGTTANSILDNRTTHSIGTRYFNEIAPMMTGKLYCNQVAGNRWRYSRSGNQDIKAPDDPTNPGYQNLVLEGSGAKRLLGNVSVKGTYTLTAPATVNTNGFALTNP